MLIFDYELEESDYARVTTLGSDLSQIDQDIIFNTIFFGKQKLTINGLNFDLSNVPILGWAVSLAHELNLLAEGGMMGHHLALYLKRRESDLFISSQYTNAKAVVSLEEFRNSANQYAHRVYKELCSLFPSLSENGLLKNWFATSRVTFATPASTLFWDRKEILSVQYYIVQPEIVGSGEESPILLAIEKRMSLIPSSMHKVELDISKNDLHREQLMEDVENLVADFCFVVDDWLGDDLINAQGCCLVTSALLKALQANSISGFATMKAVVKKSGKFPEVENTAKQPFEEFWRLQLTGKPGYHDLFLGSNLLSLCANRKALAIFKSFKSSYAQVYELNGYEQSSQSPVR